MADGLEDLIVAHWLEAEQFHDEMPLDVDWTQYMMLERVGVYRAISARVDGRLIGYNAYFVQPPLHHLRSIWAMGDVLFIDPEERRGLLGYRFIAESEALLKTLGVKMIWTEDRMRQVNSPTAKPHATLGDLYVRLGYRQMGRTFAKLL